jgi:DNA-directed RNA polymerase subunit omega
MAGERIGRMRSCRREKASRFRPAKRRFTIQQAPGITRRHSAFPPNGGLIPIMRDEYVRAALKVIDDPNILINVVSRRVKQLRRGNRALVESLEKLSAEDTALREIIEGKISYELATPADIAAARR